MTRPHVVVVGGGLAGLTAALHCADAGARVTVVERRRHLGGLTWSFEHDGLWVDNGQHVFLRCCEAYRGFLERIGSTADVTLQDRLDITVIRAASPTDGRRRQGRIRRNTLPAPAHLAASLLAYPLLSVADRARLGRAVLPLRRLDLDNPALDEQTFGAWLGAHGQSDHAITALWDLITVATVNLPAAEASLAMGAKVFQTGLLTDASAADIGWSTIPLGVLHGQRAATALDRVGATVACGEKVVRIDPVSSDPGGPTPGSGGRGFVVHTETRSLDADSVVVALPHHALDAVLPPGTVAGQDRLHQLGTSPIVDVHLTFDRQVTDLPLLAGVNTPLQWLFDRTASSGLASPAEPGSPQYVAISLSAADQAMGRRPDDLIAGAARELPRLLPAADGARLTGSLVTKERNATFRAVPGTAGLRAPTRTATPGLWLAGAWTDTGWPATMEGACRSGRTAARGALVDADRIHRLPERRSENNLSEESA